METVHEPLELSFLRLILLTAMNKNSRSDSGVFVFKDGEYS